MKSKNIRIAAWNANGLLKRKHELQVFLDIHKIDVCLISETHFTKQSFVKFRGYHTYHTIHPQNSARGGTAVIIKDTITHSVGEKHETCQIQSTSVLIRTKKYILTIAAIYCPPRHNLKKDDYLDLLQHLGERFILGGDLNAKNVRWGSRLTTSKGKELLLAALEYGCEFHSTGKPTYWPTDRDKVPDLLDFFISRKISANFIDIKEDHSLDSDHSPIILTLNETAMRKVYSPTLANKSTDWDGFRDDLSDKIKLNVPLKTKAQLDEEADALMNDIQQSAWNNTPAKSKRLPRYNYPIEIRKLIVEKRKARKLWQRTRHPCV